MTQLQLNKFQHPRLGPHPKLHLIILLINLNNSYFIHLESLRGCSVKETHTHPSTPTHTDTNTDIDTNYVLV